MEPTWAGTGNAGTPIPTGVWRRLLRTRLLGRAEPLYVGAAGLRSAASIWSGAQTWAQLLRTQAADRCVVVVQADRLALLQLLVAVLWDGRTLRVDSAHGSGSQDDWWLDGRQVGSGGAPVCRLDDGGWPDLGAGPRMSPLQMLAGTPADGIIDVRGQLATHSELWSSHGCLLDAPAPVRPAVGVTEPTVDSDVLDDFDWCALATPADLLNDALMPLLRRTEVWERAALGPT